MRGDGPHLCAIRVYAIRIVHCVINLSEGQEKVDRDLDLVRGHLRCEKEVDHHHRREGFGQEVEGQEVEEEITQEEAAGRW